MEEENEDKPLTKREKRALRKAEKKEVRASEKRSSTIRKFGMWGGVIAIIGFSVAGLYKLSEPPVTETGEVLSIESLNSTDHKFGNESEETVLIEYGDFQCPACGDVHPTLKQLKEEFGDRVTFVFRHFPLTNIHSNADEASRAAEAASYQNKFWEMHDMLFENQDVWSNLGDPSSTFRAYAEEIGLDLEKYNSDIDSDAVKNKVNNDSSSGIISGVNSTPSFFLNGEKINPRNYEQFKDEIQSQIPETK